MPSSRERILSSIRQSLAHAGHLPAAERVRLMAEPVGELETLIERFAAELALVGGVFTREQDGDKAVAGRVVALAREAGAGEVLAWDEAALPVPGLHAALRAAGVTVLGGDLPHAEPARSQALARLETCRVGLTGADAALAETGTLALRTGAGRPRLASLSVAVHIAVVKPVQFWTSWAAWWQASTRPEAPGGQAWIAGTSNVTLVTGPSRTGDIEMTLTVGVHGPRHVHVIVAG